MSYTPGPWIAVPRHIQNEGDEDDPSGLGWDIEGPPEPMLRGQFKRADDARLVAAGPELLTALQDLLMVVSDNEWVPEPVSYMKLARAAVAKALNKGRTT